MSQLSKFLFERIVTVDVNDKFKFQDNGGSVLTCTITPGRYRDIAALGIQIAADMTNTSHLSGASNHYSSSLDTNAYGVLSFTQTGTVLRGFNFDSANYGTSLRTMLGFEVDEPTITDSTTVTANTCPPGDFYPSEPVESDDLVQMNDGDVGYVPGAYSSYHRWRKDVKQTETMTGQMVTRSFTPTMIRSREITLLIPQSDMVYAYEFVNFAAEGYSFAFYHDRTRNWDTESHDYKEYKLRSNEDGQIVFSPERLDPSTRTWHRLPLSLSRRVAP